MKHAVVLLSGGLDSATTLAIARSRGYETYALSFDYGQRHRQELDTARNTIFLAHALAWTETIPAGHIFIGANAIDYSGYPDCRPEFIALFETLANVGTKAGAEGARIQIHAPLIKLSKAEIIRKAVELN